MQRYREAAKAHSENQGQLSWEELNSVYASARLHEVLCPCTPFGSRLALLCPCDPPLPIASITGFTTSERSTPHSLNFLLSHQARGRPQETEREVRALLSLLRENKAAVQAILDECQDLMKDASLNLKVLDPEVGDEELIKFVAAEVANLHAMAGKAAVQKRPGGA